MPTLDAANIALQPAEGGGRRAAGRAAAAGHVASRSTCWCRRDRARHRQHQCAGRVAGAESAGASLARLPRRRRQRTEGRNAHGCCSAALTLCSCCCAALGAFERAPVTTIKQLWHLDRGARRALLAVLLLLTGRGAAGAGGLVMFGPSDCGSIGSAAKRPVSRAAATDHRHRRPSARHDGARRRYQVLGLQPGAEPRRIRAAHRRLMRAAHPDGGGSDWLAARINQARDVLLERRSGRAKAGLSRDLH